MDRDSLFWGTSFKSKYKDFIRDSKEGGQTIALK